MNKKIQIMNYIGKTFGAIITAFVVFCSVIVLVSAAEYSGIAYGPGYHDGADGCYGYAKEHENQSVEWCCNLTIGDFTIKKVTGNAFYYKLNGTNTNNKFICWNGNVYSYTGAVGSGKPTGEVQCDGSKTLGQCFRWMPNWGWSIPNARVAMGELYDLSGVSNSPHTDGIYVTYNYDETDIAMVNLFEFDANGYCLWDSGWMYSSNRNAVWPIQSNSTRYVMVYVKGYDGGATAASGTADRATVAQVNRTWICLYGYSIIINDAGGSGGSGERCYRPYCGFYTSVRAQDNPQKTTTVNVPSRTGYTFRGYYTGTDGSGERRTDAYGNITVGSVDGVETWYAYWVANSYTISFHGNGATTMGTTSATVTFGTVMPGITIPKRTYTYTFNGGGGTVEKSSITVDYVFKGYFDNNWAVSGGMVGACNTYTGTQYYASSGGAYNSKKWDQVMNRTLYAGWERKSISLPKVVRPDYRFDGWFDQPDTSDYAGVPDTGNKIGGIGSVVTPGRSLTVYAHWTYLGKAAEIQYDKKTIIASSAVYGWFNRTSVSKKANNGMFRAYDRDGDLISFKLYPGSYATGTLPGALASGTMSNSYTTATSPTHVQFGQATGTYMYATLDYDFRKTDSFNTQAEGKKVYTLVAVDSNGHETRRVIEIDLDLTPPTLTGAVGSEAKLGDFGSDDTSTWSTVMTVNATIDQSATDELSGVAKISVHPFSNQSSPVREINSAPWRVNLDLTVECPEDAGVVVTVEDKAGNRCRKLLVNREELLIKIQPFLPSES